MTKYTKMSKWHKEVPTDDNDDDEAIPWTASTSEQSKITLLGILVTAMASIIKPLWLLLCPNLARNSYGPAYSSMSIMLILRDFLFKQNIAAKKK